jgi:hypothetical protein
MRPLAAVALGDAAGQVLVLDAVHIGEKALTVLGAVRGVGLPRRLEDRVEGVVSEIALGAAAVLAQEPDRHELVEQVGARLIEMQHAVDGLAAGPLARQHQNLVLGGTSEIVGEPDRGDAGGQRRRIGGRFDRLSVDEDTRLVAAQRLAIFGDG